MLCIIRDRSKEALFDAGIATKDAIQCTRCQRTFTFRATTCPSALWPSFLLQAPCVLILVSAYFDAQAVLSSLVPLIGHLLCAIAKSSWFKMQTFAFRSTACPRFSSAEQLFAALSYVFAFRFSYSFLCGLTIYVREHQALSARHITVLARYRLLYSNNTYIWCMRRLNAL